ncbi:hypothetical protein J5N97_011918 [Dioscorea zingiberensis]|uniref:Uncharacterized protein n=1 Tax=Dioscorea zingiberensis TaxID=325984 RepID=A0A9D5D3Z1_9LILI|nr:hypothetical protein J5N97_011918 [Dioscorea zingiberensis]
MSCGILPVKKFIDTSMKLNFAQLPSFSGSSSESLFEYNDRLTSSWNSPNSCGTLHQKPFMNNCSEISFVKNQSLERLPFERFREASKFMRFEKLPNPSGIPLIQGIFEQVKRVVFLQNTNKIKGNCGGNRGWWALAHVSKAATCHAIEHLHTDIYSYFLAADPHSHLRGGRCDLVPSKTIDSGIQIHIGSEDFILLNGYNKDGPADIHSTSDRILCDADSPFYNTVADKASFPLEEPKRTEGHTSSEAFFTFLDAVKECYEAFVIAKFLALMYSYLNISISKNIVPDEIKGREVHHSFPMTLFQPHSVKLNHHTLKLLKYWTWQFVIIRPVCSVLMIALELLGWYTSWISWAFTIILNISVSLALYALVVFYHVFKKRVKRRTNLWQSSYVSKGSRLFLLLAGCRA